MTLLAPISQASPCGEDLAFSAEFDAIAKAREADDPTLEQGPWASALKEADWKFVASRCADLLATRSKDLRLAVWMAEAQAKTGGLQGLGDGLLAIAGLCERYWDGIFPLPDEGGFELRIGSLGWIAARVPLLVRELDGDGAAHCLAAVIALERVVDQRLGADGPSFGAARTALENRLPATPQDSGKGIVSTAPGPLLSRAQALAQLRSVAEFFRRTEPHSPVAYLADKAAMWGEQPLHVWLRGVVKDDAVFAQLEEMLGTK
ncbi:MAG: type VI secretion system protein TssA [Pseudomonadota bacterium]